MTYTTLRDYPDLAKKAKIWCPGKNEFESYLNLCCGERDQFAQNEYSISVVTAIKDRFDLFGNVVSNLNSQEYKYLEHVVIDASNTAKNMQTIAENALNHTIYLNENDLGLYDGFNKGLLLLKGKYFSFLNSDDWYEKNFCKKSIEIFKSIHPDFTFGNIMLHKENFQNQYISGSPLYFKYPLYNYIKFHHNTVMCNSNLIYEIGLFIHRIQICGKVFNIKIGSDYHWFLESIKKGKVGYYIYDVLGHMRWGGASNSTPGLAARECGLIAIKASEHAMEKFKILFIWVYRYLQDVFNLDNYITRVLLKYYRKFYLK